MNQLITGSQTNIALPSITKTMLPALADITQILGIPRDTLASDEEIEYAWKDLPRELKNIPSEMRGELIARMCVAVGSGLFDGAINYAWNASNLNLRDKVRFFGLPVVAQILQKDFEERHLLDLQDSQLLDLCLKLNIINEDGYFFLDQCRDVRNNFSAAHPTLGKINDREFVSFLNRCTKYALSDSSSLKGVDITSFITAMKQGRFTKSQTALWTQRLADTHDAQRQLLVSMVHGIYCDPSSSEQTRLNGLDLCQTLKDNFSSKLKSELIDKHSDYLAKGDDKRHTASLQFFEKLGIISLLNESEKHTLYSRAIGRLWDAHCGMNNFHNEPPFAERLCELSAQGEVPETAKDNFVFSVTACFLGNPYGVSWAAEPYYSKMISAFSPKEISIMIRAAAPGGSLHRMVSDSTRRRRFKEALGLFDIASVPSGVKADYEKYIAQ